MTRVLILGASGMLGNAMYRFFGDSEGFEVAGTVRTAASARRLPSIARGSILPGVDVEQFDSLTWAFAQARPDVVVNCIGVVKQLDQASEPLTAIPINAVLPHRLAQLSAVAGARLVHVSTDCVFSGRRGGYKESDFPDADDLYGRSKLLGEVDYPHAVTLRTSIIGHEIEGARSLLCWFLSQHGKVRGYKRAIFSGLPTVELARLVRDFVLPNPRLKGLYHVASAPINKYDLLTLFAQAYGKAIEIEPFAEFVIDRSLDATRFGQETGYVAPDWPDLVSRMAEFR